MERCVWRLPLRLTGLFAMLGVAVAAAQTPPATAAADRPIRLIVPLAAGGPTDAAARVLADGLAQASGRTVLVENKPGAATMLGAAAVAMATPDGDTLGIVSPSFALHAAVGRKLPYKQQDLVGVTLIGTAPLVLVAPASSSFSNVRELVTQARRVPGRFTYGSFGVGSSTHLFGELLQKQAGIGLVHVPFKGSSQALPEVIAGRVDLWIDAMPSVEPYLKSGQLKVIGTTGQQRMPELPDLPTVPEIVPGAEMGTWLGVVTRAGMPNAVRHRLQSELVSGVASSAMKDRLVAAVGIVPVMSSPESFDALIQSEIEKWRKVVREANVTIDQ